MAEENTGSPIPKLDSSIPGPEPDSTGLEQVCMDPESQGKGSELYSAEKRSH